MIKLNLSGKCIVDMIGQVQNMIDTNVTSFRNERTLTFHPRYGLGIIRSKSFVNEGFSVVNLDFKVSDKVVLNFDFSKFNDLFFLFIDLGSVNIHLKDTSVKSIGNSQICMVSNKNLRSLDIDSDQHIRMYVVQVYSEISDACIQNGLIGLNRKLFQLFSSIINQSDIFFLEKVNHVVKRSFKCLFSYKSSTLAKFYYHKACIYLSTLYIISEMHEKLLPVVIPPNLEIKDFEYIQEVLLTVPALFSKPHAIERISERSHINISQFRKGFKMVSGLTLNSYIKLNRLDTARNLIENSKLEKKDILKKIGVKNEAYFDRIFKNTYGMKVDDYFLKHRSYA